MRSYAVPPLLVLRHGAMSASYYTLLPRFGLCVNCVRVTCVTRKAEPATRRYACTCSA